MDTIKKQEIINKLMEKFKQDYGDVESKHVAAYYLRGVVDALWEYDQYK